MVSSLSHAYNMRNSPTLVHGLCLVLHLSLFHLDIYITDRVAWREKDAEKYTRIQEKNAGF